MNIVFRSARQLTALSGTKWGFEACWVQGVNSVRLLYYANADHSASKWPFDRIETMVSMEARETYSDLDSLHRRLCRPRYGLAIAVLVAATGEELGELLAMRDLLADLRLILVLPDRSRETIKAGHRLAPRFLSYVDSGFEEVEAVLEQMLQYSRNHTPEAPAEFLEDVNLTSAGACLA
jgi:hypothetical protein